ncbi:tRNA (guanosine-2'-O-)-methyltransferase [Myroides gitamensis]|uniref:tRNA (guanosine(18)-2'-O)-methyltransferase n=1 Tax=Myroides odoratus TaxID=256 RepID=A0A378RP97_MYROD|nr:RNA methyltransferase [Myroides odoratus]MCS4237783.1 tRNA (guanosine-2'-O-)-methyltransferase [Myroides odoratus]MDH6599847.1 tRNA (guanosine-2'-O-)-methyltransferase [Myroides gitamensis]QQU04576.1 RNA methyltransferase [Myroides odoratus]STZ27987.1 tRNA (guanosine(18)-2'-O)-methyltransferase [Myroides odoratus]
MNISNKLFQDVEYLAYLETFLTENRVERFKEVLSNRTNHITVVAEDVYQLHNTSAVMRSCEVFGVQGLHVIEQKFGKRIDKQIALGAEKWVDIHRYNSVQGSIDAIKAKGYKIVATTPHGTAQSLDKFDLSEPVAIFFGTEKSGLSPEIIEQADDYITIPMVGFTESLNISVSAAIIIQSLSTRLRESAIPWQLPKEELLAKRIDWARKSIKDIDFVTERYLENSNRREE